ncbi:MAG TPA: WYL domain-containing protein [Verrucomicrobiae bacterium]|nr:WYL domain-containing protein [Verrucomicrobiae bacterium]
MAKIPSLHSRPPLERMMRIHQALQSGNFPNASRLAQEIEVAPKTIHRDMEFMRDRMNLPIEFDASRNGYFYDGEVSGFPSLQITEGELFALVVAEKALQQYRGTSFEKPLLSAIKKMEQSLPDTISLNLSDVGRAISFRTSVEPILDLEVFDTLARAVADRRQLELDYRKPGAERAESRIVDPYHLANVNGEWFLFAFDHTRKDIRKFAPSRMRTINPTGKTFERSGKFSLEKQLRNSFGIHSGQGQYNVVIRFNARAADYIREKKWHESQQLRELKQGAVELRLELSSLVEIERWILSWGGDAKVIQPRQLSEAIRRSAKKILGSV